MQDLLLEPMAEPGVGGAFRKGYAAPGLRLESLSELETSQKVPRAVGLLFFCQISPPVVADRHAALLQFSRIKEVWEHRTGITPEEQLARLCSLNCL
jgi:hypothetical protein